MQEVDLAENALREIPPAFGKLLHLEKVNLRDNHLLTLPKEISMLKNLKVRNFQATFH